MSANIELVPDKVVAGGEALARDADGRVVLVEGGIPGERVRVEIHNAKKTFARGRIVEVLDPSPDRVTPPCPHVATGCGGCDWQYIESGAQRRLRRDIVVDALARLGKIGDSAEGLVAESVALADAHFRTSVRVLMVKGRPAFRKAYSHDPVLIDSCLVAHPLIESLLADAQFDAVKEAEIRCGTRTGERMVIAFPTTRYLSLPDDVVMIGADDIEAGKTAMFAEEAAGRRWRISATSFFQTRADGADALAQLVKDAVPDEAETVVDLYAGVGLFAGTIAKKGRKVIAVEGNPAAVRDAKHNLASDDVKVDRADISRWDAIPADVVIADPSRAGLGADVVSHIDATDASRVILVACDAASLGRDVRLLGEAGFGLTRATPVDLFPHTSHVEVVAVLDR